MSNIWSIEEYEEYRKDKNKKNKKPKYNNKRFYYNGNWYDSTKEAKYAMQLDLRVKAKEIVKWERQVPIEIHVNGEYLCSYICDFFVYYFDGTVERIDIKGMKEGAAYRYFKLKQKLIKLTQGIDIIEK